MGVIGAFVGVGLNFFDMGVGVGVLSCIFENPFCDQFLGLGVSFGVNLAHWSSIGCSAGGGLPMQSPPISTRRTMAGHPWFVDPELARGGGAEKPPPHPSRQASTAQQPPKGALWSSFLVTNQK